MIETELDHTLTPFIICPYCGYEDFDSFEYRYNDGDINCSCCAKQFHYERNVDVMYTTKKLN
jgi:hypothetical protein